MLIDVSTWSEVAGRSRVAGGVRARQIGVGSQGPQCLQGGRRLAGWGQKGGEGAAFRRKQGRAAGAAAEHGSLRRWRRWEWWAQGRGHGGRLQDFTRLQRGPKRPRRQRWAAGWLRARPRQRKRAARRPQSRLRARPGARPPLQVALCAQVLAAVGLVFLQSSSSARRYSPQSAWWKTTMALGSAMRHSVVDLAVTPKPRGTSDML